MTANDVTKLPKWARDHIARLEANVEHWKAKALAACVKDGKGSNVAIVNGMDEVGLPPGSTIRFTVKDARIEVRHATGQQAPDGVLSVYAREGRLLLLPASSNMVHLCAGGETP